jgi:hypothetical protein
MQSFTTSHDSTRHRIRPWFDRNIQKPEWRQHNLVSSFMGSRSPSYIQFCFLRIAKSGQIVCSYTIIARFETTKMRKWLDRKWNTYLLIECHWDHRVSMVVAVLFGWVYVELAMGHLPELGGMLDCWLPPVFGVPKKNGTVYIYITPINWLI